MQHMVVVVVVGGAKRSPDLAWWNLSFRTLHTGVYDSKYVEYVIQNITDSALIVSKRLHAVGHLL